MTISAEVQVSQSSDDKADSGPAWAPTAARKLSSLVSRWRWPRRVAVWYWIFAVYAAAVAAFSGPGLDQRWGQWATGGYAAAALLAARWPGARGGLLALIAAVSGALIAPILWLATQEPGTSDGMVVTRSAALLIHHGAPYLPAATLAHSGWLSYNPYLPVMAVFGLPKALGLPGLAGDTRPWLAIVTFGLLVLAFRTVARASPLASQSLSDAVRRAAYATACPLLAFPLALSITDPPITALVILALASLTRSARGAASVVLPAIVIGVACAMKYTAWPALAVLVAMTAARDGSRAALRFVVTSAGVALALDVALARTAWRAPSALIDNTIAYPLGLTSARSPAQSPLPGHILSTLGPVGHTAALALLIVAGSAIAASLIIRAPADTRAASYRLALGLTLLFALSPTTRFGYLAYPLAIYGWLAVSRAPAPRAAAPPGDAEARDAHGLHEALAGGHG